MKRLKPVQVILLGFLLTIMIGSVLLMLPVSSKSGQMTPYIDSLFTATTSVCVTGLVVETTMTHWSFFGQLVIAVLIQIGGLGVVTITAGMFFLLGKRISLSNRMLIQESMGLNTMSGLVVLVKKIFVGTFIVEGIGALLYATQFIPEFGWRYGIWASIFNSISAFCNAGMDIVQLDSLRSYVTNPVINFTTMGLIVLGGLGFIVWKDMYHGLKDLIYRKCTVKRAWDKLRFHSKVAITATLFLIIAGTVLIFIFEFNNPETMKDLNVGQKLMASMFQSVTTRTAGFETIPQAGLSEGSSLISMILMFIGGSPVGTAGGVKTVTFIILIYCVVTVAKQEDDISLFRRKVSDVLVPKALAIIMINLSVLLTAVLFLLLFDDQTFMTTCYECVSALATVGLSKGMTPELNLFGKIIIIITMYLGRVGPISMAIGFSVGKKKKKKRSFSYPEEELIL
ncbi:potassium transporter KtrB [Anaerostipes sp. 494a]|uniref:TrkH family potassium uptake protein n=1 Tax=Anaerostipes sp. 494a TaxID=1261636 RepID=UPI000951B8EA|nr:potassium transporter TrkG [Anaerostipes sp. 494a]OLR59305.1 potassium transporter KtrB [Anaerostipes sp. 494a]